MLGSHFSKMNKWVNCYPSLQAFSLPCLDSIGHLDLLLHLSKWYGPTNHSPYLSCTRNHSSIGALLGPSPSSSFHQLQQKVKKQTSSFFWTCWFLGLLSRFGLSAYYSFDLGLDLGMIYWLSLAGLGQLDLSTFGLGIRSQVSVCTCKELRW